MNFILMCSNSLSSSSCLFVWPQVRAFYTQVLSEEERQRLCQNMAGALKGAQLFIQKRMVSPHCVSIASYILTCQTHVAKVYCMNEQRLVVWKHII